MSRRQSILLKAIVTVFGWAVRGEKNEEHGSAAWVNLPCKISLHKWLHTSGHKDVHMKGITYAAINSVNVPYILLPPWFLSRLSYSAFFMIDYTVSQGEPLGLWGPAATFRPTHLRNYSAAPLKVSFNLDQEQWRTWHLISVSHCSLSL